MHPTNADVVVELNSKNQAFWCPSPSPPRRQPVPLTKLEYLILNHLRAGMTTASLPVVTANNNTFRAERLAISQNSVQMRSLLLYQRKY
jgi:hypothetical protein